jgi:hypothetical protein
MFIMKKLGTLLFAITGLHLSYAEEPTTTPSTSISLEAGYIDTLHVNGVPRVTETPYIAATFAAPDALFADTAFSLDLSGGALLAGPNDDVSESHWNLAVGKTVGFKSLGLRVSGEIWRHQSGTPSVPDSTEIAAKVSLVNPIVSPYVKLINDFDLDQKGYAEGAETSWTLPVVGWELTPDVSWYSLDDYESFRAAATVSYPGELLWGLSPFVTFSWVDNDFDVANFDFASYEAESEHSWLAGVKYSF